MYGSALLSLVSFYNELAMLISDTFKAHETKASIFITMSLPHFLCQNACSLCWDVPYPFLPPSLITTQDG